MTEENFFGDQLTDLVLFLKENIPTMLSDKSSIKIKLLLLTFVVVVIGFWLLDIVEALFMLMILALATVLMIFQNVLMVKQQSTELEMESLEASQVSELMFTCQL